MYEKQGVKNLVYLKKKKMNHLGKLSLNQFKTIFSVLARIAMHVVSVLSHYIMFFSQPQYLTWESWLSTNSLAGFIVYTWSLASPGPGQPWHEEFRYTSNTEGCRLYTGLQPPFSFTSSNTKQARIKVGSSWAQLRVAVFNVTTSMNLPIGIQIQIQIYI